MKELRTMPARLSGIAYRTRVRQSHTNSIFAGHEGYITVGLYEDRTPGELFITMAKEGSTIGGLMDTIGTLVSMAFSIWRAARNAREEILAPTLRAERLYEKLRHPIAKRSPTTSPVVACEFIPRLPRCQLPGRAAGAAAEEVAEQEKKPSIAPSGPRQTSEVPHVL